MQRGSTPPMIQNVFRLETIAEEELTCQELSEEDGEDVPTSSNNKDLLDATIEDWQDTLTIFEDSCTIDEHCESSVDNSEEQRNECLEEAFQEVVGADLSGWREVFNWDDFAYNLILGFLPTAWDVFSDLGIASYLKANAEVDSAGLSYLFICFPGLHMSLDLLIRRLSFSCDTKVVIFVNVLSGTTFSFAMLFSVWNKALLFEYPAFLVGMVVVGVKAVALVVHTPAMKAISSRVTKYETDTESPLQLLLLLHIWVSGGPLFLAPIASSLLIIGKVNAEAYLSSPPKNLLEGKTFLEKLKLTTKFLPLFISTTFFRVGSGMIKHSGPYSSVAESYQTLFFFFTVLSGCIIYYMFYVAIFWGVKLIFVQQLTDITLMEGARSVLAEFSTVSLWGNLGRIRSRYFSQTVLYNPRRVVVCLQECTIQTKFECASRNLFGFPPDSNRSPFGWQAKH